SVRLNRRANRIAIGLWHRPVALAKRLKAIFRGRKAAGLEAKVFSETDYFDFVAGRSRLTPFINAYCWAVLQLMRLGGSPYVVRTDVDDISDRQVLILARRGA